MRATLLVLIVVLAFLSPTLAQDEQAVPTPDLFAEFETVLRIEHLLPARPSWPS